MSEKTLSHIEKQIIKEYKNGNGVCEIAKNCNLYRGTVLQILNRNGIKTERITRPYKNKFDISFFSEYTNISAYWAGFIYADGYIHNRGQSVLKIALKNTDKSHLKKFSDAIRFTGKIHSYKYGKYNSSQILVSGKWFSNDLLKKYNITNRKSLTITFPNQIPKKYLSHFIRGIFDGDGCVTKNGKNCPCINITGNTKSISIIRKIFLQILKIRSNKFALPVINKKNKNICCIGFSANKAKKILDWIYLNSNDNIRLNRKYKRYIKYFERYT